MHNVRATGTQFCECSTLTHQLVQRHARALCLTSRRTVVRAAHEPCFKHFDYSTNGGATFLCEQFPCVLLDKQQRRLDLVAPP